MKKNGFLQAGNIFKTIHSIKLKGYPHICINDKFMVVTNQVNNYCQLLDIEPTKINL